MKIFNKILYSYAIYAMYCRKEMEKILKCYLIPKKKSYGTLSKGAILFGQPCIKNLVCVL